MPAGTSWPRYMAGAAGAFLSMLAGSQAVHVIYEPLVHLNDKVEEEKRKIRMASSTDLNILSPELNSQADSTSVSNSS